MSVNIHVIGWQEFELMLQSPDFISNLENNVYIIRGLFNKELIDEIKDSCLSFSSKTADSWYPCIDDCPDYHRLHNNFPGAYVKAIQHAYYFHPWNDNDALFDSFKKIFSLKLALSEQKQNIQNYMSNIPSDGPIARIVVHQYPRGGGGQEEHIDPVSPYARVQTIIQASVPGDDFMQGGLYLIDPVHGRIELDRLTSKGDLIVLSPGVRHGVAPVDPESTFNWQETDGRWIIMPIIINSDVSNDGYGKPVGLGGL
ncbi:hypothetical protein LMJ53_01920 [Rheinheimera sp. UJ51]|uniref:hypothetical protein n=1 Tax=Rheinheimera sp. UJ51 TaxID=2892446 RepID=UPI001E45284E|nr:hypothetical protein [Rheinheimera sp. UJ51]MCC5450489.1 hypothetical protein [Rheinheimera sp. UJ51]